MLRRVVQEQYVEIAERCKLAPSVTTRGNKCVPTTRTLDSGCEQFREPTIRRLREGAAQGPPPKVAVAEDRNAQLSAGNGVPP